MSFKTGYSCSMYSCSAGELSVDEVSMADCDSDVDAGTFLKAAIDRRVVPVY